MTAEVVVAEVVRASTVAAPTRDTQWVVRVRRTDREGELLVILTVGEAVLDACRSAPPAHCLCLIGHRTDSNARAVVGEHAPGDAGDQEE